ncbi:MAG: response regulator, partial [Rubrivivax sp.]|nr:response regulator [Rubrivivax sp.]
MIPPGRPKGEDRSAQHDGSPPSTMPTSLRVLLVDDHALLRAGVRTLIERDLGARITAECDTGAQALHAIAQEEPDVAMLDITL